MALSNKLLDLLNCNIRFNTPEGEYEGLLRKVLPAAQLIVVSKVILLPDRRMGTLNFVFSELTNIRVINQTDRPKERNDGKKEVLPVYPKKEIEKLFDFDGSSDIEDGETSDRYQVEYKMKIMPHLSKFLPRDFEIIDSFNNDFNLAIKHIKKQSAIGVSLEGIKISRSGTLTWLCISTPYCNFLFDILVLGQQAFQEGLKSILEDAKIQKILHDCRLASDCLYHKYNVRLVNVFDTQVADFIVMMQMTEKDKINSRVNGLDACLSYYLEIPDDYLYGRVNFDEDKSSLNFHALRPLHHDIQDVLIKNVMYLHLLKRELELALQTPLRRATDVYLNSIQKLEDKELQIVPHKSDELPAEMHLEGIQIFRYRDFEYLSNTVASGPPYRTINNPMRTYLNNCAEYKNGKKKDKESEMKKHENGLVISSKSDYNSIVDSSGNSSDSDYDTVKNQSIMKSEVLPYSKSTNIQNPIVCSMLKLIPRSSRGNQETMKGTTDESNQLRRCDSSASVKHFGIDSKLVVRDLKNANEFPHFKSVNSTVCSNDTVKTETSQIQQPSTMRNKKLLGLIAKMQSQNRLKVTDTSSGDTSASEIDEAKNAANTQLLQTDNSAMKNEESCSDSDLEELAARVRARGILFHNLKAEAATSHYAPDKFSKTCETKSAKEISKISRSDGVCASQNMTVYCSKIIGKSSKVDVKINNKSSFLADLYKKAGDMNSLWTDGNAVDCDGNLVWAEEDSETDSKSFSNQYDKCENNDNFWSAVKSDELCKPVDEKLRLRLIPAGMSGY